MGWRGDTDNGRICWFIVLAPPNLVLLTTIIGLIPILIVFILYGIILYHAIRKVMQLKKATENSGGAQAGNLRLFRGGQNNPGSVDNLEEHNQMSETEEQLQPKKNFLRFFKK